MANNSSLPFIDHPTHSLTSYSLLVFLSYHPSPHSVKRLPVSLQPLSPQGWFTQFPKATWPIVPHPIHSPSVIILFTTPATSYSFLVFLSYHQFPHLKGSQSQYSRYLHTRLVKAVEFPKTTWPIVPHPIHSPSVTIFIHSATSYSFIVFHSYHPFPHSNDPLPYYSRSFHTALVYTAFKLKATQLIIIHSSTLPNNGHLIHPSTSYSFLVFLSYYSFPHSSGPLSFVFGTFCLGRQ